MFSPTHVVITIDRNPSFTQRYGKQVERLSGGSYGRHPRRYSRRTVTLPWTYQGKRLANEILRTYPHLESIISFEGLHPEYSSSVEVFYTYGEDKILPLSSFINAVDKRSLILNYWEKCESRYHAWERDQLPAIQSRLDARAAEVQAKKSAAEEAIELLQEVLVRAGCVVKTSQTTTYNGYGHTDVTIADLQFTINIINDTAKRVAVEEIQSDAAQ